MTPITIAQISDLHCGSPHFVPELLGRALGEINELAPDVVVVSGDLTSDGFRAEYEDEQLHRGHFSLRGAMRPAERYHERFAEIRVLQAHLVERARAEGVTVLDNVGADATLRAMMDLVLDTVGRLTADRP